MNILLLTQDDILMGSGRAVVKGRRFSHIKNVLKASSGDELCVGMLNGKIGKALVKKVMATQVEYLATLKDSVGAECYGELTRKHQAENFRDDNHTNHQN